MPINCPYPQPAESSPYPPIIFKIHLILFSLFCLCLPSGLLPSGFPTITQYVFLISRTHAPCPTSLITLDAIKLTVFGKHSLCTFLQSPYASFLLGPHHPILHHPRPMLFPYVTDQVPHPCPTTGRIRVLYILCV